MPCYRCGARQSDPEQGKSSPWKRGVRREHQVLICPECLGAASADLDGCDRCGGTRLIRRLDQIECVDCGLARDADPGRHTTAEPSPKPAAAPPSAVPRSRETPLSQEVTRALDRVLHQDK
jgi:hypothetical protein